MTLRMRASTPPTTRYSHGGNSSLSTLPTLGFPGKGPTLAPRLGSTRYLPPIALLPEARVRPAGGDSSLPLRNGRSKTTSLVPGKTLLEKPAVRVRSWGTMILSTASLGFSTRRFLSLGTRLIATRRYESWDGSDSWTRRRLYSASSTNSLT